MRVLITRPEREATALAQALGARGHSPVIAPFFRLQVLHPPDDFAASLADCQAVLITSANGARALAEAGSAVVLNGLGVGSEIAKTRDQISADYDVKVSYSPPDMTRPAAIRLPIRPAIEIAFGVSRDSIRRSRA